MFTNICRACLLFLLSLQLVPLSVASAGGEQLPLIDAAPAGSSGITLDNTTTTSGSDVTVLSWPHMTNGTDRLLLVGISYLSGVNRTVTGVSYAGQSLTRLVTQSPFNYAAEIWYAVAPAPGQDTVSVTFSRFTWAVAGATSWTGVDQTVPLTATATAVGESNPATITISSQPGEVVQDVLAWNREAMGSPIASPSGSQTQQWNLPVAVGGASSSKNGATNVSLSWSLSSATGWVLAAASIAPAQPDSTPPVISSVSIPVITSNSATVTWSTNEPADSQIDYGLTAAYGSSTPLDSTLAISHSQAVSGLQANTLYHYRVKSRDAAGNLAVSGDTTFVTFSPPAGGRPNIIVIMTDDQDVSSMSVMTRLQSLLVQSGVTFSNFFTSYPLCCPSRATLLTGQYAHNHGVMSNAPPTGGYGKLNHTNTLPLWLQNANYVTAQIGKYLNGYGLEDNDPGNGIPACREIPPGWDEWYAFSQEAEYLDYVLNEQGQLVAYGLPKPLVGAGCAPDQSLPSVYSTDLLAKKAEDFINRRAAAGDGKPFFLYLNFYAPHGQGENLAPLPAARHQGLFETAPFPTAVAYNEADVSDKPAFIRNIPLFDSTKTAMVADAFRRQLESLLAVDEGVDKIVQALSANGQLDSTVIFYTSDHGFALGEHRWLSKVVVYEESIKAPLVVRGPGFSTNAGVSEMMVNVDLAPTILELAQASPGLIEDGRSFVPFLQGGSVPWRDYVLLEAATGNMNYQAVRDTQYVYVEHLTEEKELYDLAVDPWQLTSQHNTPGFYQEIKFLMRQTLDGLRNCVGASCWPTKAFEFFPAAAATGQISAERVRSFSVSQNYPNPFNASTEIRFDLPEATTVRVDLFNILGQKVTGIEKSKSAGRQSIKLDASALPSGVYVYRIRAGAYESVRKMILMK